MTERRKPARPGKKKKVRAATGKKAAPRSSPRTTSSASPRRAGKPSGKSALTSGAKSAPNSDHLADSAASGETGTPSTTGIRLQKFLSDRGLGSRRHLEQWIADGRIRVDGKLAELGQRVSEQSRISIDGRPIRGRASPRDTRVLVYNKPEGEICSRDDPGNRPTVFRHLPRKKGERWVAVGRLDINTRGLLLFTNNGDLANELMHPDTGLEREYVCRVFGTVSDEALSLLKRGVDLDGEQVHFQQLDRVRGEGRNTWYRVVVTEGRYREVRRLWEAVGCQVSRLVRVRYGDIELPRRLKLGEWLELSPREVSDLLTVGQRTPAVESVKPAVKKKPRGRSPATVASRPTVARKRSGSSRSRSPKR